MIAEGISRFLRSAATITVSLGVFFPVLCTGQSATPPPSDPTVFSNPRAPSDDPRVGLKGGLYDAGEAAFGMQRIGSLPKPSGFAPGDTVGAPAPLPCLPRRGNLRGLLPHSTALPIRI